MPWTGVNPVVVGYAVKKDHYDVLWDNAAHVRDVLLGAQDLGSNWLISTGRELRFSDPDVAHGMTGVLPTDVYGLLQPVSGTAGGFGVWGLSDSDAVGLQFTGIIGTATPSATTPAIAMRAYKKSGTSTQVLATGDLAWQLESGGSALIKIFGDGGINAGLNDVQATRTPSFGFGSQYKVLQLGSDAANRSVSLNLDPSGITGSNFTGTGQILIPKNRGILAPDAAGTNWSAVLMATGSKVYVGGSLSSGTPAGDNLVVDGTSGIQVPGIIVGFAGTPVADEVQVGDANFKLDYVSSTDVRLVFDSGEDSLGFDRTGNDWSFRVGGTVVATITDTGGFGSSLSTSFLNLGGGSAQPLCITLTEKAADAPNADANNVHIYAKDNGAGKTQVLARFNTGAAVQIAIEP